jgi:hypothetical protein
MKGDKTNGAVTQVTCTYQRFDPYLSLDTAPRILK